MLTPGDPLTRFESPDQPLPPEERQKLIERWGLDQPWHIQYLRWAENFFFRLDFGESLSYKQPVWELIQRRIWPTVQLSGLALLLALVIAIPIGTISALKQYSLLDNSITALAFFGVSMPNFWFGLVLIYIFAVWWGVLPAGGMMDVPSKCEDGQFFCHLGDRLAHLFLPVVVLATASIAGFTRYMRSQVLEIMRADYVDTARAKGIKERIVISKHILKNAIMPLVTLLGLSLPILVSGALITEQVFGWPGLGWYFWQAAGAHDYTMIMGILTLTAIFTLVGNFLADILYAFVDPRIRYD